MYSLILIYKFILIPFFVGFIIQGIKILIDVFKYKKKISFQDLWTAWWFPSVHSWISSSLITLLWIEYGFSSSLFAISFCFWFLFWYDAANIRYQAWQHAQYLNYLYNLLHQLESFGIHEKFLQHLKERLWHTVIEVIGGIIFGVWMTLFIVFLLLYTKF